jgi:uncharacterized protein
MSRVVHFEILADNLGRASRFYRTVFGWKISKWGKERYLLITTGSDKKPGINGALMPRMKPFTGKNGFLGYICTVEILGRLTTFVKRVEKAGGKRVTEPQKIPGVGTHAYFTDTEGNIFGIMQAER